MDSIVAKRCYECGGEPQYVHYCVPEKAGGYFEDDEFGYSPMPLYKRLECKECGATVFSLSLGCDRAVEYWNKEVDAHRLIILKGEPEKIQIDSIVVKKCSECDGEPQLVNYIGHIEGKPDIILKRLECEKCHGTVFSLVLNDKDAIEYWNTEVEGHRPILQRYIIEMVSRVEPKENVKQLEPAHTIVSRE